MPHTGPIAAIAVTLMLVAGCTDWDSRFFRRCEATAAIEVRNQAAWHRYLSEVRKERAALAASVSSNPIVSNSLEVRDLIGTAGFDFTNSWVLGGQKEIVTGTIFENDYFVIQQETGEQVARIANLHLTTPGFGHQESWDCISNYSQLYRSHM